MHEQLTILAIDAFHGGSHRAFLNGWEAHSRHRFTKLTFPPRHWKWRMRHVAVTCAQGWSDPREPAAGADVLFCTDMLNLAELRGLCPPSIRRLPAVVYFHENQLTYPDRARRERDLHFAFTNLVTALAADGVWFNSGYHRDAFLDAADALLRQMPDYAPRQVVQRIRAKSFVHPPGIAAPPSPAGPSAGPLRVLWVARWEHDKSPEVFFAALTRLRDLRCDFRLNVLGEGYREAPECFATARSQLDSVIDHWGYVENREAYWSVLQASDVVVSTAAHEFFGIAMVEAVAAGCRPLVPRRLAYPEVLGDGPAWFHNDDPEDIARRLHALAEAKAAGRWDPTEDLARRLAERYAWDRLAEEMDHALLGLGRSLPGLGA